MEEKGKTILVVEDDEETLNVLSRTLAAGGYDVMWARNGVDTLKQLDRYDGSVALLIVDVVLPGMSGPDLAEKVSTQYPGASALYVSAYDADTVRSHGVDPDTMAFLAKPYEADDLLHLVRELVEA